MTGSQLSKFRLFCLLCKWEVELPNDTTLWVEHAQCPECAGPTDGYKLGRPRFLPPPKRTS